MPFSVIVSKAFAIIGNNTIRKSNSLLFISFYFKVNNIIFIVQASTNL